MAVTEHAVRSPRVGFAELINNRREASLAWCYKATIAITILLAVAAAGGLFFGAYRDNAWVSSQMRGQDFVSLVFAVPLLLASAFLASRGSTRAQLVWLGALGYVTYSYLYIFGITWNRLFLVYLLLLTLSGITLVRALLSLDATAIAGKFNSKAPLRAASRYLSIFGIGLGALWGAQALVATVTGEIPKSVIDSGHPTGVVFILDLGLVVPLFLIGAHLLRRRHPWGFVAAGALLVKGIAEGLALLGMSLFMYLDEYPVIDVAFIPLWAAVAVASTVLTILYLRAIDAKEERRKEFVT